MGFRSCLYAIMKRKIPQSNFFVVVFFMFTVNMHGFFPLKDKKGKTITKVFQKIVKESNHKPDKIWIDKGSEYYNRSMKSWFESNNRNFFNTIKQVSSCRKIY